MRVLGWLFGIVAAVGCGKQLNPDFCAANPTDGDCRDAGLSFIDAPPPCTSDTQCGLPGKGVCDPMLGACVQCIASPPGHASACTGETPTCSPDDVCVGCYNDSQCASNVCLSATGKCASVGSVLFVAVGGTGNCHSTASKCTLATAITAAVSGSVIQMDAGDYHEGPLSLGVPNLTIQAATGQVVTITSNTQDGPVFTITNGPVTLQNLTIYAARNADAIACNASALTLDHVTVRDNPKSGLHIRNCDLTVDRSWLSGNVSHAMDIDSANVKIRNSFIYANGNGGITDGAVKLGSLATGEMRFTTVAFNTGKTSGSSQTSGLFCNTVGPFNATDNLFASNTGTQVSYTPLCAVARSWVGSAATVNFVNATAPYDLHLTANTPTVPPNAIRDNGNTDCGDVLHDVDNDVRPYNQVCDLGADEYKP